MRLLLLALALAFGACTSDDDGGGSGGSGDASTPCGQCLFSQCCQNGSCVDGNSPQTCGTHGNACRVCDTGPCINGSCVVDTCNALSCRDGCCSSGGCQVPPSNRACGINGNPCDVCGVDEICEAGQCSQAIARSYRVILVGANLPAELDCSSFADPFDDCDPYAIVTFAARGDEQIRTSVVDDSMSPTWNKELISAGPGELTSGAIKVQLFDDDTIADVTLGTCQVLVTREDLVAGSASRSCRSDGLTFSLNFRFRPIEG